MYSTDPKAMAVTVAAMKKLVQQMTLPQLRDELDRTRPAWEAELAGLDGALADGQLPASSQDAQRHQLVVDELLRRPSTD
jgi:hypothetical protein